MNNWHIEAEKQWDQFAAEWSSNSKDMWENGSRKKILPFFLSHLKEGSYIADLGCGDGYGTLGLARHGMKAIGLDLSKEMVDTASDRAKGFKGVQFIQGDLSQLPFESDSLDGTMAINSLEWTENPLHSLNEIRRIVKTDGVACFGILGPTAAPRQAHSYKRLYGEQIIMNSMMPWEFARLAEENGWKLIDDKGVEKREAKLEQLVHLPKEIQQAVCFMWLFILKKI
ncbi:class I SAM-dependent methyltransferase [Peribacillus alkalitolerans]|uniref:class I SAM-dependent methyltransferase n=1 Tax=Peribacillus alkalitolerans TaxID=1550385 RepID=UPI0013D51214|nr:class I SAM-dependent methyltransferase [Peribacillus alkalitolerans]